jgi:non-ribosomal peptide synthetase component F
MFSYAAFAQRESLPIDLPNGPAKPGFDVKRLSNVGNGHFKTFYVTQTQPLQQALNEGKVAADTRVLVLSTASGKLALLTDQMSFHHLAQGTEGGKTWMATF